MGAITYITQLNINGSGAYQLYVNGTMATNNFVFPNADGNAGQFMCTDGNGNLGWGDGGVSNIWADGTNLYIVPCNSCGVCMTGDIVSANSTNCLGCAASPGAFKELHVLCSAPSVCICSPIVCGTTVVCGGDICAGDDVIAGDDICAGNLLVGTKLNINASSACTFYVSGDGIYSGTLNITYVDGTCICGSRKLRIPVGTNCY